MDNHEFMLRALEELKRRDEGTKFFRMFPDEGEFARDRYPRQMEFFALGASKPYRCLVGANGSGKSVAGAYETVCHLTGIYPDWWEGKRYTRPINNWSAGVDFKSIRESVQKTLIGPRGQEGTGMIPRELLEDWKYGQNDVLDYVVVKHASGGLSRCLIKTYVQGRESFQAANVDDIWLDEEPEWPIYSECIQRFRGETAEGHLRLTFTPLFGASEVISMFLPAFWPTEYTEEQHKVSGRAHVVCTVNDVPHISEEEIERKRANMLPHERGPRLYGEVSVGEGRVYPFSEDSFVIDPVKSGLPNYWPRLYGLDNGLRVTAAVWAAHDTESDVLYIYSEHYLEETLPPIHAEAIKARGHWIPGVVDPASRSRNQVTGEAPLEVYKKLGLLLREADNSVQDGIYEIYQRFETGRIKIYKTCTNLLRELRMYSRDKNNKIIKRNDHACDALRYIGLGLKNARLPHADKRDHAPRLREETFGIFQ